MRGLLLMLIFFLLLWLAAPVQAIAEDTGRPSIDPLLWEFIGKTHAARDALQAKSPAEWTDAELEDYFYNAAFVPYYALIKHINQYRQHPSSAAALGEWMGPDDWPGNPLNDWEPMALRYDDPTFHPGDLAVMLCPHEWASRASYSGTVRLTFQISIFGPTEDYLPERELFESLDFMPPWPEGTSFGVGAYWGPAVRPD